MILNEYLRAVDLSCVRNKDGKIAGFMGVADDKIEMLFIHPDVRGKGIGKILVNYTLDQLGVKKVDVNEANEQAVGFYQHAGFLTVSRSALDSTGQPLPVLHMALITK
ncbi:GNAT family N-acetyltransferase [Spirosoma validum]|uniref:GNAT family N-acetyltransferase n=1 Tax=Spirosoma validum TaxID=2771355 RepID=UPI001CC29F5E|nr:GNAT family N-acetyltransferase [Spirosoma validum]